MARKIVLLLLVCLAVCAGEAAVHGGGAGTEAAERERMEALKREAQRKLRDVSVQGLHDRLAMTENEFRTVEHELRELHQRMSTQSRSEKLPDKEMIGKFMQQEMQLKGRLSELGGKRGELHNSISHMMREL